MDRKTIKLYDMDSMEYAGCIEVTGARWEYRDVCDEHMLEVTAGMPLKALLACLVSFNYVYDVIEH